MKRKDTVTRTVQVLDIVPGDPPQILTGERLSRGGKPGRQFQQMIPVRDADLFARFVAQVGKGSTVTVTVTTEWRTDGYETYLADFALPHHEVPIEPEPVQA
jgi:hypothetical protein